FFQLIARFQYTGGGIHCSEQCFSEDKISQIFFLLPTTVVLVLEKRDVHRDKNSAKKLAEKKERLPLP
ncbi:hypothetical protein HMPREF1989_02337, partial [Porphyromonas gingivalis F0566]|uniref:hypothetical protein n=1 Tax=Porphyromonas gingivalis TaxID=837 RepID=UPI0003AD33A2